MPTGGVMDIPKLSVVVPVYNERATIHLIVEKRGAVPLPMEIIAVNDCSRDGSAEILDRLKEAGGGDVVGEYPAERGKGAARSRRGGGGRGPQRPAAGRGGGGGPAFVVHPPGNGGRGAALRTGIEHAA